MGFERVSRLPDGIGAVKDTDFEGLFILLIDSNREKNYRVFREVASSKEILDQLINAEKQGNS